ncbi:MAG: hypothetical protein H7259_00665 [Cytophagales bacterium]|nr:hypothetical protein [Cytophaga sp.]
MKYILLLSCIISNSIITSAQNSGFKYTPFGMEVPFERGYCITHSGIKLEGYIAPVCGSYSSDLGSNYIMFVLLNGDTKKQKLTTKDVKTFVAGKDSFAIIKSFSTTMGGYYNQDFARVVKSGSLNLYLHCHPKNSGFEYLYYVRKSGTLYRLKRGEFKDRAGFILGDDPELMEKLKKKQLNFDNLEQIIEEYNARKKLQGMVKAEE